MNAGFSPSTGRPAAVYDSSAAHCTHGRADRVTLSGGGGAWLADFGEGLAVGDDRGAAGLGDHMVLQAKQTATHRCAIVRKHTNKQTDGVRPSSGDAVCVRACVRAHIAEAKVRSACTIEDRPARVTTQNLRSEVSRVQHNIQGALTMVEYDTAYRQH